MLVFRLSPDTGFLRLETLTEFAHLFLVKGQEKVVLNGSLPASPLLLLLSDLRL